MQSTRFIVLPLSLKLANLSRLSLSSAYLDYLIRVAVFNRDKESVGALARMLGTELARHYRALVANDYRIEYYDLKVGDRRRASVLLTCSQLLTREGELRDGMRLCSEAHRFALSSNDWPTAYMARKDAAVMRSIMGDHKGALADLEVLDKLNRFTANRFPFLRYDYLNSLAVELGEVGRAEEALNASRIALASPYASAYPEWRETGDELKMRGCRPSHNFVAFNAGFNQRSSDTGNVVTLPVSTRGNSAEPVKAGYNPFQQPARILDFQSWKKTMRKESNDTPKDEKTKKEMTSREMLLKLIELISEKDLTDDQLERMLEAVESIACESQNKDRQ